MPYETIEVASGEEYFAEDRDQVYCRHGKYIGYPGGVDYICPYCEDGANELCSGLRYNIDICWRPEADPEDFSTIIRCWGDADLRQNLSSLRFLFGAALKGSVQVRIVVIKHYYWAPELVEVPVPFRAFEEGQNA